MTNYFPAIQIMGMMLDFYKTKKDKWEKSSSHCLVSKYNIISRDSEACEFHYVTSNHKENNSLRQI
jgi:hypothetical protein